MLIIVGCIHSMAQSVECTHFIRKLWIVHISWVACRMNTFYRLCHKMYTLHSLFIECGRCIDTWLMTDIRTGKYKTTPSFMSKLKIVQNVLTHRVSDCNFHQTKLKRHKMCFIKTTYRRKMKPWCSMWGNIALSGRQYKN